MKKIFTFLCLAAIAALLSGCAAGGIGKVSAGGKADGVLGDATTKLMDDTPSRVHNIELAMERIKTCTLKPGDEFSFNGVVGERTAEGGYQEAVALFQTEKVMEIGGGVCQLSTTIYQAAKSAGMKITERHQHKKKIPYAKKGEDATVDYAAKLDLKFTNTTGKTVKLDCGITDGELTVTIAEAK